MKRQAIWLFLLLFLFLSLSLLLAFYWWIYLVFSAWYQEDVIKTHIKANHSPWPLVSKQQQLLDAERWANRRWSKRINNGLPFILFVHIFKTAGSSVKHVLYDICGGKENVVLHKQWGEFLHWTEQEQRSYCGLFGHLGFGMHFQQGWRVDKPVAYMTFLRDPLNRTVSQYNFDTAFARKTGSLNWNNFSEYYDHCVSQRPPMNCVNPATFQLSHFWSNVSDTAKHEATKEDLRLAKQRLQHEVEVVGLVERFTDSLLIMSFKFGHKFSVDTPNIRKNESKGESVLKVSDLTEEQKERILKDSQLDLELLAFARELFETRWQAMQRRRRKGKNWAVIL